jgi:hypothetical protein
VAVVAGVDVIVGELLFEELETLTLKLWLA